MLVIGPQPLINLSGALLQPPQALTRIALAWASVLPPALGFTAVAVLVSVATRSSVAGIGLPVVVGLAMQGFALIDGPERDPAPAHLVCFRGLARTPGRAAVLPAPDPRDDGQRGILRRLPGGRVPDAAAAGHRRLDMRGRTTGICLRGALVAITTVAVVGCGSSPITEARIEGAIEPTFANLVQVQVSWLGMSPVAASDVEVTASCRRLVIGGGVAGAGEWVCSVMWEVPDRGTLFATQYDLLVTTDGCYTAMVDGSQLGGPTLKAADGRDVRNLLYTFEGCFDTT